MLGITRQTLPSLQLQGIEVDSRWGPHGMVRSREARKVALSWFSVATQGVLTHYSFERSSLFISKTGLMYFSYPSVYTGCWFIGSSRAHCHSVSYTRPSALQDQHTMRGAQCPKVCESPTCQVQSSGTCR